MEGFIIAVFVGVFLLGLIAWRIHELVELHSAHTPIDPTPEVLGPKEVQRRHVVFRPSVAEEHRKAA